MVQVQVYLKTTRILVMSTGKPVEILKLIYNNNTAQYHVGKYLLLTVNYEL